jgi:hypothetical protein
MRFSVLVSLLLSNSQLRDGRYCLLNTFVRFFYRIARHLLDMMDIGVSKCMKAFFLNFVSPRILCQYESCARTYHANKSSFFIFIIYNNITEYN